MVMFDMIRRSPVAAVISNPRLADNPIVECNDAFTALTGYAREDIIGRNCRFLHGPQTEPDLIEALREGIRSHQPVMVEILNYKQDGTAFRNAVMIAPIFDAAGVVEYYLGSQVELRETAQDDAATRRAAARARIDALSPRQHDILLHMAAGRLNKQIAFTLQLSERTVKMHRAAVLRILDVRTSADAIRLAVEAGL